MELLAQRVHIYTVVPEWVLFDSSDHNKDFYAFLYVQYAQK